MLSAITHHVGAHARHAAAVAAMFIVGSALVLPLSGFAAAPTTTTCAATDTQCVITFGNQRIAERQTALSTLNTRVNEAFSDHHITSDQNSALVADIAANENGLNTLKSQLDSAPDAKTARSDVKLIYTQYRIYAVVLPRDYHEIWLDEVTNLDSRFKSNEPVIQDAINGAPSSVHDQANQLFQDFQTQVTNAQAQTAAANQILPSLTPANFNSSPTSYSSTFANFKTDVRSAHIATAAAASDLHKIAQLLKSAA